MPPSYKAEKTGYELTGLVDLIESNLTISSCLDISFCEVSREPDLTFVFVVTDESLLLPYPLVLAFSEHKLNPHSTYEAGLGKLRPTGHMRPTEGIFVARQELVSNKNNSPVILIF